MKPAVGTKLGIPSIVRLTCRCLGHRPLLSPAMPCGHEAPTSSFWPGVQMPSQESPSHM